MNPTQQPLDRLIKSAGRSRQEEETLLSFRTEARVLAHWRTLQSQPHWLELVPLLRRGLACASAAGVLPLTEAAASREVTLPLYPAMQDADVDWVVNSVTQALAES